MTELSEDRVWARHPRRRGAVLIVGAGSVGGFLAVELAGLGFSPIRLVDYKVLKVENLVRHPLGAQAIGQPKASALASKIRRDLPCDARGLNEDFRLVPEDVQRRMVDRADIVVAATDTVECQRRVNEVCLAAEKPAVYPAVWVDQRVRDAEVGEILWVLPGRHTPCYLCATAWRQGAGDAQARGGTRADIKVLVLATALVVAGLLDRTDAPAGLLDPEQTCIYVHGFSPPSPAVRNAFQGPGLQSRAVHVPFPTTPCPACGGHEPAHAPTPRLAPSRPPPAAPQPSPPPLRRPSPATPLWPPPYGYTAPPVRRGGRSERVRSALATFGWATSAVLLIAAILGIWAMGSHAGTPNSSTHGHYARHSHRPKHVAIPPTHTRLICDRSGTSAYARDGNDCTSGNMYNPDTITLEVRGLTHRVVRVLCKRGYTDEWSSRADPWISRLNEQKYLGASGMCAGLRDQNFPTGAHGYLEAEISNPGVLGKDTVTWRLRSPSGKVVLKARYSFRVLETEFSGKTPS